jgi:hypothetical protein
MLLDKFSHIGRRPINAQPVEIPTAQKREGLKWQNED